MSHLGAPYTPFSRTHHFLIYLLLTARSSMSFFTNFDIIKAV